MFDRTASTPAVPLAVEVWLRHPEHASKIWTLLPMDIVRVTLLVALVLSARPAQSDETKPYDPIDRYRVERVEGWTIRVSDRFENEDPQLFESVQQELERQLKAIRASVPADSVERLQEIEIWVEVNNPLFPCMCYHVSERWLKANGVNPAKTGHVELANAKNFLSWTKQQPWMVLHELAHGYHDRFLRGGYGNERLIKAHREACDAGRYGEVDHVSGRTRRHYASTNPMEFFAEGTEALFGKNDFYPFDRSDLSDYDPALVGLLEDLWAVSDDSEVPAS